MLLFGGVFLIIAASIVMSISSCFFESKAEKEENELNDADNEQDEDVLLRARDDRQQSDYIFNESETANTSGFVGRPRRRRRHD